MPQHHRAFALSALWTLGLLYLGSVVHATESSLACPDWPTCFGTMVPEMEGGVFWEHLHRLVAGGLIVIFSGATWLAYREPEPRRWVVRAALAGIGLLLVQSVFGGLTVIFLLPDWVSTTHLGLAFAFLALATVLTVRTSPADDEPLPEPGAVKPLAISAAGLTFAQSVLGGLVRHTDSGLVCPDIPQCLGRWVPPLGSGQIALHFFHRVTAIVLTAVVIALVVAVFKRYGPGMMRKLAMAALVVTLVQVGLGVLSVTTRLAVTPVSLHTLVGATMLTILVGMSAMTFRPSRARQESPSSASATAGAP